MLLIHSIMVTQKHQVKGNMFIYFYLLKNPNHKIYD